ncbi:MAG: efflux RND transporter periplasmic adaptor subunit [Oscillospiraceae bacterium]|nr:efflux RND transporter periplasmic adaptor subunit [Oscillospiraceae bacterium]
MAKKKQEAGGVATQEPPKPRRKIKIKTIVWAVILLAAAGGAVYYFTAGPKPDAQTVSTYLEEPAQRRDIVSELSYSGTLEPADSYTVTGLVSGEILSADFEEGDMVRKDDVLYTVDASDAATGVERAENSLQQAQRSYNQVQRGLSDLNIQAPAAGQLVSLDVEVGDNVVAGQSVGLVRDGSTMSIELPFPADEAVNFYIGQAAQVTVDGSFETLSGTVTKINASDTVLIGNRIVRMVTIEVQNPGAMTSALQATATVGASACAESGTFAYRAEKQVIAAASGKVASLPVAEGGTVYKDQTIVVLSSDNLQDQLANAQAQIEDAQLALDNQRDTLDNYAIESPIDGTIIDKSYKQGDNLEPGKALCTIFDLRYLSFIMYVDELDISQVQVGQKVEITAEALPGETFEGTVTKVSINGTTTGGVTAYPVTVQIDEMGDLLPGMNVDASVVVSERRDVLSVPVEAVSRGNQVLVKTDSPTAFQAENPEGIPVGYEYVEVTLGSSNDDYIEITGGLDEGAQIAYQPPVASGSDFFFMGGSQYVSMSDGSGEVMVTSGPGGGPGGPGGGGF